MESTRWIAGGYNLPGTNVPANVTGDCPHLHLTSEAAQRCISATDKAIKRGHGRNAYCDRIVIEVEVDHGHVRKLAGGAETED